MVAPRILRRGLSRCGQRRSRGGARMWPRRLPPHTLSEGVFPLRCLAIAFGAKRSEHANLKSRARVGRSDGTAHGGHLLEARVRPTCELILTESPTHLQKKLDPRSGIVLIQI